MARWLVLPLPNCLFFPSFRFLSLPEPFRDFIDAVPGCRYSFIRRLFLPITLRRRKNLQEIHFKPPDQARQPTFASEKSDGDGREETVEVIHIIDIKGRGLRPGIRAEEKREV